MFNMMNVDEAAETLDAHHHFRVLHRLHMADALVFADKVSGEPCCRLAVIGTETTD